MIIAIIGGTVTFLVALTLFYIAYRTKRPKHWSQGYVVLGKNYGELSKKQEPQQENSGMFPPGW